MTPEKIAETRAKAAKILAEIRAGTFDGDARDIGRQLDGRWDQDFPTALLEVASMQPTT